MPFELTDEQKYALRLSHRIVIWIFICVIVIETIIFIPSFNKRKHELLDQLKMVSAAKFSIIMQTYAGVTSASDLLQKINALKLNPTILGGAMYDGDGNRIGVFGDAPFDDAPLLRPGQAQSIFNWRASRYDVICPAGPPERQYTFSLRHDASWVKTELKAFGARIGGLVILISVFVTLGAWLALKPIVVTPVVNLRNDLVKAGESIRRDLPPPEFSVSKIHRFDELGQVIHAFKHMYDRIVRTIGERKAAEDSLQVSLAQVEAYSKMLNKELEQGRRMQSNFIPSRLPAIQGWEFAAFFSPARQVAGDFYDVFELPGRNYGLVVADVCDKGVGAALFMALFRSLIRIFSGQTALKGVALPVDDVVCGFVEGNNNAAKTNCDHVNALEAVRLTNHYIELNHGTLGMFATLFFGVLDPADGLLTYINAGHETVFVVGPQGVKHELKPSSAAVGVMPTTRFLIESVYLEPCDILIAFTDGVTESRSPQGEYYGRERMQALVDRPCNSATARIEEIKRELFAFIDGQDQEDDITLLAVQRAPVQS